VPRAGVKHGAADQAQTGKFWGGAGPASVHNLATLAQTMGDFDRAGSCYDESIADFAEVKDLAEFARATRTCRSGYAGGCRR